MYIDSEVNLSAYIYRLFHGDFSSMTENVFHCPSRGIYCFHGSYNYLLCYLLYIL